LGWAGDGGRLGGSADAYGRRMINGGGGGFVPLAIDASRSEAAPFVDEVISVEVSGFVSEAAGGDHGEPDC